jgi:phosphohistidine phosphatase
MLTGMKTLLLLRHAKSSWNDASLKDFDRPLNERGLRAAPLVGRFMREQKISPDLLLCSPARRARETVALVKQAAHWDAPVRFDERIYEAGVEQLIEVISQIEEKVNKALLVGHNPGMEALIFQLTGEEKRVPTAALAQVTLDIEKWGKTHTDCGTLDWLVKPKQLEDD